MPIFSKHFCQSKMKWNEWRWWSYLFLCMLLTSMIESTTGSVMWPRILILAPAVVFDPTKPFAMTSVIFSRKPTPNEHWKSKDSVNFPKDETYSCMYLNSKNHKDSTPIKHIMHGCSCKCPFKFRFVSNLGDGYQSIGNRSSNICSHNQRNGKMNIHTSSNGSHNNWSKSWWTLDQNSAKNTNHESNNWIVQPSAIKKVP